MALHRIAPRSLVAIFRPLLAGVVCIGVLASPAVAQDPLPTVFGSWRLVEVGVTHHAATAGFILAYSSGTGGGRFTIRTGPTKDDLRLRNRGNHFDGATVPVKRGHHYQVRFDDDTSESRDSRKNITAYWLPITAGDGVSDEGAGEPEAPAQAGGGTDGEPETPAQAGGPC